jgi:hypothetical protein
MIFVFIGELTNCPNKMFPETGPKSGMSGSRRPVDALTTATVGVTGTTSKPSPSKNTYQTTTSKGKLEVVAR